jgi:hypothetical protein
MNCTTGSALLPVGHDADWHLNIRVPFGAVKTPALFRFWQNGQLKDFQFPFFGPWP